MLQAAGGCSRIAAVSCITEFSDCAEVKTEYLSVFLRDELAAVGLRKQNQWGFFTIEKSLMQVESRQRVFHVDGEVGCTKDWAE